MPKYELKAAILKIRQKPLNFSLFRGDDENQILITAKAPTAKEVAEVEAECGKAKRMLKGICFLDGERLVFATRIQPAPAWEMMITQVLKQRGCTKWVPIALRLLSPNEPDEVSAEEGEGAAAAVVTPAAPGLDFKAKWERAKKVLLPVIKQTMAVNPAAREKLTPLVAEALQKERTEDFPAAINAFERLAPILKAALAAAPKASPVTPPPPPPIVDIPLPPLAPPAPGTTPGRLTSALNRLAPAITSRLSEAPARRREIGMLVQTFQTAVKARELMAAKEALARLGLFVKGA